MSDIDDDDEEGDRTPSDHMTRSQRMIKLNNPYDEI